jgi:hypothetical protein
MQHQLIFTLQHHTQLRDKFIFVGPLREALNNPALWDAATSRFKKPGLAGRFNYNSVGNGQHADRFFYAFVDHLVNSDDLVAFLQQWHLPQAQIDIIGSVLCVQSQSNVSASAPSAAPSPQAQRSGKLEVNDEWSGFVLESGNEIFNKLSRLDTAPGASIKLLTEAYRSISRAARQLRDSGTTTSEANLRPHFVNHLKSICSAVNDFDGAVEAVQVKNDFQQHCLIPFSKFFVKTEMRSVEPSLPIISPLDPRNEQFQLENISEDLKQYRVKIEPNDAIKSKVMWNAIDRNKSRMNEEFRKIFKLSCELIGIDRPSSTLEIQSDCTPDMISDISLWRSLLGSFG